jgi:hypothetical protein
MAVAWDATGAGAHNSVSNSISTTHTASGSNRAALVSLVVGVVNEASYTTWTRSCTYGGVSMTSLGVFNDGGSSPPSGFYGWVELFGLLNPATGSQTVSASVTKTGTTHTLGIGSVSYTGVTSFGTPVVGGGTSSPTLTVASATGDMTVAAFASGTAIATPTKTQRFLSNFDGSSTGNMLIEDAAGAASVTLAYADNSDYWCGVALDLVASGAAAPTNLFFQMF